MSKSIGIVLEAHEMGSLYNEKAGEWLLLEVVEEDSEQRPLKLRLLAHSFNKEDLYEYILEDEDWNWDKKYLFVFSDPNKACDLT